MKTIVFAISTIFLFSFTILESENKDDYIIPKDTKKAARIINEAFATPFKSLKFKASPNNIKFANKRDLQKLIESNPNIPKDNKIQLLKETENWRDLQATIIDFDEMNPCEGESNFTMILEAGSVETRVAFVYSTCGIFRCVLSGYTPQNGYNCSRGVGPIQTVQLCTESADLCCVYYYCPGNVCPNATCMEKNNCPNCD